MASPVPMRRLRPSTWSGSWEPRVSLPGSPALAPRPIGRRGVPASGRAVPAWQPQGAEGAADRPHPAVGRPRAEGGEVLAPRAAGHG